MIKYWSKYKVQFLLSLLVLAIFWPISTFYLVPKWDNIDCYLPYRYFVSNAIWQGEWPFWNPSQMLGYPAYSDMQNGMYSPITWILTIFGRYDITSLIIELLFYYVIGIIGAYKVSSLFVQNTSSRIFVAIAFGLSGFMLSTSQIMIFISGGAFLPHILYHFISIFRSSKKSHLYYAILFVAFNVTVVSPSYSIVLVYILLAIIIYQYFSFRKLDDSNFPWLNIGVFSALLILVLLPYINATYEFLPYFKRARKLEYGKFLLENPFYVQEYISFLFPYATFTDSNWFGKTDISMRSAYIGILPFIFFLHSLKYWKEHKILIVCVVIFLVLSAGGSTPLYRAFYELPGFGLFRHPSLFRAHLTLFLAILAGIGFEKWRTNKDKSILYLLVGTVLVAVFTFTASLLYSYPEDLDLFFSTWDKTVQPIRHAMRTYYFVNSIVVLVILGLAILFHEKKMLSPKILILLTLVDIGIYSQLTSSQTVHLHLPYDNFKAYFDQLPDSVRQTDNTTPYKNLNEHYDPIVQGLWRNTATYHNALSYAGHNQTQFIEFNNIEDNGGYDMTIENPLFYEISDFENIDSLHKIRPNTAWDIPSELAINSHQMVIKKGVVGRNAFSVTVENESNSSDILVVNQNFHHQWRATINEQPTYIFPVNQALIGIEIPPHFKGKVQLNFNSPRTKIFTVISIISYLILFVLIMLSLRKKSEKNAVKTE